MKKLLSLISTIGLIATLTSNISSCSKQPKNILPEGEIKDLSDIENLKIRINTNKGEEQIMSKILNDFQFKGIKSEDVKFKSLKLPKKDGEKLIDGESIVESSGKNEKVIGQTSTIVLIALEPQKDINSFSLTKNLVDVEGTTPNVIIKKFLETNKDHLIKNTNSTDFSVVDLKITKPSGEKITGAGKAKIAASAESELYFGFVDVEFSIIQKYNFKDLNLKVELGEVKNNGLYEVCHIFWSLNQDKLKNSTGFKYKINEETGFEEKTDEDAVIVGGDSELYVGEIKVFFNIG